MRGLGERVGMRAQSIRSYLASKHQICDAMSPGGDRAIADRMNEAVGVQDQATLDLWTAVMTGLADQQISDDPGRDRRTQLVDRAVDMLLADVRAHGATGSERTRPP